MDIESLLGKSEVICRLSDHPTLLEICNKEDEEISFFNEKIKQLENEIEAAVERYQQDAGKYLIDKGLETYESLELNKSPAERSLSVELNKECNRVSKEFRGKLKIDEVFQTMSKSLEIRSIFREMNGLDK